MFSLNTFNKISKKSQPETYKYPHFLSITNLSSHNIYIFNIHHFCSWYIAIYSFFRYTNYEVLYKKYSFHKKPYIISFRDKRLKLLNSKKII